MAGKFFDGTTPKHNRVIEAAYFYEEALLKGEPPVKAVTVALGCSMSTATRLIQDARRAGLIKNTGRDVRHPKVMAVAIAVGVSYDTLLEAIQIHASGDIRVREPKP